MIFLNDYDDAINLSRVEHYCKLNWACYHISINLIPSKFFSLSINLLTLHKSIDLAFLYR